MWTTALNKGFFIHDSSNCFFSLQLNLLTTHRFSSVWLLTKPSSYGRLLRFFKNSSIVNAPRLGCFMINKHAMISQILKSLFPFHLWNHKFHARGKHNHVDFFSFPNTVQKSCEWKLFVISRAVTSIIAYGGHIHFLDPEAAWHRVKLYQKGSFLKHHCDPVAFILLRLIFLAYWHPGSREEGNLKIILNMNSICYNLRPF